MSKAAVLFVLLSHVFFVPAALARDYTVETEYTPDMEALRPFVEGCRELGALEGIRESLENTWDLEDKRQIFELSGGVTFEDCPRSKYV